MNVKAYNFIIQWMFITNKQLNLKMRNFLNLSKQQLKAINEMPMKENGKLYLYKHSIFVSISVYWKDMHAVWNIKCKDQRKPHWTNS